MANDETRRDESAPRLPLDRAFVIQFGCETAPARDLFQGRVEHISSGQVAHFQSLPELKLFVERVFVGLNKESGNTA